MVKLQFAIIGALALAAVGTASCGSKQSEVAGASNDGAGEPTASASSTKSVLARREWTSQEGNRFFYENDEGRLIGVTDLGQLPQDQDFHKALAKGDRAIAMDGRQFAALTPGSNVVRVVVMRPGEQVFREVENVPLAGNSVAARAMRDSLAGLLTYPSEAALRAQAQAPAAPVQESKVASNSDAKYSPTYNACMSTGDAAGGVTAAMADCNSAEFAAQDARLNAAYKAAMATRNSAQQAQLRDAQRAWIKTRDAKCAEGLEGGTMDILTEGGCHLSMTTERADALAQLAH